MSPSASPRSRRSERGGINWVTFLLLLSTVTGAYLAVVWAPVYIVRYEVGMLTTEYANKAVRNDEDAALVKEFCERLGRLDQVKTQGPDGAVVEAPAVDLRPADITWERDTASSPPTLHIAFEYTTSVHYRWLDRFAEKTFTIEKLQDIKPVKW
jgi:hypothetical protein